MNKHLSMRSGNPALNKNTFKNLSSTTSETMTIDGTVNKTAISLIIQPADRVRSVPRQNTMSRCQPGKPSAATHKAQRVGHSKRTEPTGLSNRAVFIRKGVFMRKLSISVCRIIWTCLSYCK